MSTDEKILMLLGEVRGDVRGMGREIKGLRRQMELQRVAYEEQGKALAALPCAVRGRQISDLYRNVGAVKEDTGVFHIEEIKRKARRLQLAKLGALLLALAGLVVAAWQVIGG